MSITSQFNNQRGITLLEIMLVMTISVSVMLLGLRFYAQFQFQANEQKIAGNVDQLFLAMEGFYYANCRQRKDTNSDPQSPGRLDPSFIDTPSKTTTVVLGVKNDLVGTDYFIPTPNWRPNNPLVDNSPTPDQGYYVQFNRVLDASNADPVMSVAACTKMGADLTNPRSCDEVNGTTLAAAAGTPTAQSQAVTWVVQVAVKLSPDLTTTQWTQIQYDLNATCMSSPGGGGVIPCTSSPAGNGYLVWTRTPSYFNKDITSDYWTATPYVRAFNMQYTNDGMAALAGVTNETTGAKTWNNPWHYLCGG